jgi:hypothetical protein
LLRILASARFPGLLWFGIIDSLSSAFGWFDWS